MDEDRVEWLPAAVALVALVLAGLSLLDLATVSVEESEQVLFGRRFRGGAAQSVTVLHIAFFAWLAWAAMGRKRFVPAVVLGYALYLIVALWLWTTMHGRDLYTGWRAPLLINIVLTLALLSLCRWLWERREVFDQ